MLHGGPDLLCQLLSGAPEVMFYAWENAFAYQFVPTMKGPLFSGKQLGRSPRGGLHSPNSIPISLYSTQHFTCMRFHLCRCGRAIIRKSETHEQKMMYVVWFVPCHAEVP